MSLKPAAWWPEGAPIANQQGRVTAIWLIKFQELLKAVLSALGITGTPVAGNLTVFSSVATITNGDLSGDVTTAGSTVTTIKPDLTLHSLTVTDDIDVTNDANAAVDFWFGSADGVSAPIRVSRIVDAATPVYVEYPGIVSVTEAQSSGNSSGSVDGAYFAAFTSSTDTHNYSFMSGTTGDGYHLGSGTIGKIQGHFSDVANAGAGTVDELFGFESLVHVDSGTGGIVAGGYTRFAGGGTVSTALYGWAVSDAYGSQGPAGKTFPFYFGDISTPSAGLFFVTEKGYTRTPALTLPPTTVALLPSPPTSGMSATVNDALSPVFGSVVAGGGTFTVDVFYDGAAWIVMGGAGVTAGVPATRVLTMASLRA